MELHEANRILRSVKSAMYADGVKLPQSAESDGLLMLLGKLDVDKHLAPKIKHARAQAKDSTAFIRSFNYIAFLRALSAVKNGLPDPVTSVSIMLLHKTVCGDLDPEAGKPRCKEYSSDGCEHTDPKYIQGSLKSVVAKMNDTESSPTIGKEDFAGYITHYMRELVIMHPFENGSDFTVRLFIMMFCKLKGFSLCYYRTPVADIRAAEEAAFRYDDISPMYKSFMNCLSYEHTTVDEPQKPVPQTRRELGKVRKEPARVAQAKSGKNFADIKIRAAQSDDRQKKETAASDDVLKRAIKLQQKITRLNEQLTELMTKSGKTDNTARRTAKPTRSAKSADKPKEE